MEKYIYHTACRKVLGDLHTPVSVYMRVRDMYPKSVLLECSDYHGRENSRSFIAVHPIASVSVLDGKVICIFPDGHEETSLISDSNTVDSAIRSFMERFSISGDCSEVCGLYGYMSFNAVKYFDGISIKDDAPDVNDAPDLQYVLYKDIVVFDHFSNEMILVELLADGESDSLELLEKSVSNKVISNYSFSAVGGVSSTLTDEEHKANVALGIKHCMRGDVFQVVLSRRFVQKYEGDDFKLYRALRSINPSPYLYYFDFGGFRIMGSSPETHCRIQDGKAYIDPIAGTARRTGDTTKDSENAARLAGDPKENAEHVMLVDLARNDLSRNCRDVHLEKYKEIQYYSHVIHMVSRVCGTLDGADPVKTFIDTFPAGTLSGAPKVRAMQLISQYEPHSRGAYGGCIGVIGFDGYINQAITIRSFISRNGELWFQAGSGIVASSNEEYELQEVNSKLAALRKAIIMAEKI